MEVGVIGRMISMKVGGFRNRGWLNSDEGMYEEFICRQGVNAGMILENRLRPTF